MTVNLARHGPCNIIYASCQFCQFEHRKTSRNRSPLIQIRILPNGFHTKVPSNTCAPEHPRLLIALVNQIDKGGHSISCVRLFRILDDYLQVLMKNIRKYSWLSGGGGGLFNGGVFAKAVRKIRQSTPHHMYVCACASQKVHRPMDWDGISVQGGSKKSKKKKKPDTLLRTIQRLPPRPPPPCTSIPWNDYRILQPRRTSNLVCRTWNGTAVVQ